MLIGRRERRGYVRSPQPRSRASRIMARVIWAVDGGSGSVVSGRARRAPAGERIQGQGHEPSPGLGRVSPGDVHDRRGRDQQQHEVLADEILAQRARGLGPVDHRDEQIVGRPAELLDLLVGGERHGQQIGQATVTGLQFADPLDEPGEAVPRVGSGQRLPGHLGVFGDLLHERGGDQLLPGREAPVQGGDAHASPGGDRLERRFQPVLGEYVPRHGHDGGPVSLGVGPQPPLRVRASGRFGELAGFAGLPACHPGHAGSGLVADGHAFHGKRCGG